MAYVPTTSTRENTLLKIGGGPINNLFRYMTKINLGLINTALEPKITTPTHYYSRSLRLRDIDEDAEVIFDTSDLDIDVDQYIRIPVITNVESGERRDRAVLEKTAAVLENKSILLSTNKVTGSSAVAGDIVSFQDVGAGVINLRREPKGLANQVLTMNGTATGLVWTTPGAVSVADNSITDAKIAAHTSTKVTITTKAQLNTQIGYKDEASWLTDSMMAAHTSTKVTITAKGQLNSQIAYLDATAWLTNAMVSASAGITYGKLSLTNSIVSGDIVSLVYSKLTSVPTTFTPSAHTHPFTEVTSTIALAQIADNTITDAKISAHTSTKVSITAKGQLNSAILYNDVDNALGAHYVQITKIAAPSAAPAGTVKLYVDSTSGLLSQIDQSGVVTDLSAGSGGGGTGDVTGGTSLGGTAIYKQENASHILEFKGLNSPNSTIVYGANADGLRVDSDIGSGVIADSHISSHTSTKITITAKGQLNSQIAYLDATAWLTDAMVATHTSTKISITAKGQLNSSIAYIDQPNTFGDFDQKIRSGRLKVSNPLNTFFYVFTGAALTTSDKVVNLPLLTGPDEILFKDFGATITNKTINFSNNTGTNIGDSAIAAHTSTKITITTKAQLNSQIAYLDATAWLTDAMVSGSAAIDWTKINKTGSLLSDMANVVLTTPASQDLLVRNASSQWVNLAKGANNTMLGVNGSGNLAYSTVADANIASHTSTKITITTKAQLNSQIAYLDATAWLTDAMVATHTSTKISITNKSQLNSAILYNDVNPSFGAHHFTMNEIANPATAAANTANIFVSSATGYLSMIDDAGVVTNITAGSGGGGITTSSVDTLTNKTILDTGAGNQIGVHIPHTFTIYQDASNYFMRNNWTGVITSFANTDLSPVIEAAITGIAGAGNNNDSVYGGSVFVQKGAYTATSKLDMTLAIAARHGIKLIGEGEGSHITFSPGTSLPDAILIDSEAFGIERIFFSANANVTNIIHVVGIWSTSGRRSDYGRICDNMFEGSVGKYTNTAPTAGQTAIFVDGSTASTYFGKILRNHFGAFAVNIKLDGSEATSYEISGNTSINSEKHITISGGSGQHDIENEWIQGGTNVGITGVEVSGSGGHTSISHITTELHKTGANTQAILLNTGVGNTYIGTGISNVWDDGVSNFKTIVDNSGDLTANVYDQNIIAKGQHYQRFEDNIVKTNSAVAFNFFPNQFRVYDADYAHYWKIGGTAELGADRVVSFQPMTADGRLITSNMTASPFKYTPFLYHVYIDSVDSKFKALNCDTLEVQFTSSGTTDARAFLSSVFSAASTARRPVYINKGDYPCLSQLDVSGLWLTVEMARSAGDLGGTLDPTYDAVIRKNYAGNTSFILWSTDVGGSNVSYSKQRWINANIKGDGDGNGFELIGINENPDCFQSPIITNFKEGMWLRRVWETSLISPSFYNCSEYAIHCSGDPTNPTTTQCVLVAVFNGNFRVNTQNVYIERGMQIKLIDTVLEGATGQLNSVEITSAGLDTEIRGCSFESAINAIDIIKDGGMGSTITHNRFGGLYSTNQNVYHATSTMNKALFKNNNLDPYTANATATVLLDSGSTQFCFGDNKVLSYATGVSLVFTDNSGNSATHIITPNFSNNSTTGWGDINFRNTAASGINRHIKFGDSGDLVFQSNGVINFLGAPFANVIMDPDTGSGTGIKLYDSDYTNFYKIGTGNITVDRRVGIPDMTADGDFLVTNASQVSTNKTINTTDNSLTATSQAAADILVNNGTKFVRKGKGTGLQILRTNIGATDLEWASLDNERIGKATASGNGSTTAFTIAHGLGTGSAPSHTKISVSKPSIGRTYTVDATNITVTFDTAPASASNNIEIYWEVVA